MANGDNIQPTVGRHVSGYQFPTLALAWVAEKYKFIICFRGDQNITTLLVLWRTQEHTTGRHHKTHTTIGAVISFRLHPIMPHSTQAEQIDGINVVRNVCKCKHVSHHINTDHVYVCIFWQGTIPFGQQTTIIVLEIWIQSYHISMYLTADFIGQLQPHHSSIFL